MVTTVKEARIVPDVSLTVPVRAIDDKGVESHVVSVSIGGDQRQDYPRALHVSIVPTDGKLPESLTGITHTEGQILDSKEYRFGLHRFRDILESLGVDRDGIKLAMEAADKYVASQHSRSAAEGLSKEMNKMGYKRGGITKG